MRYYFLDIIIKKLEEIIVKPDFKKELKTFFSNEFIWLFQKALLSGEYHGGVEEKLLKIDQILASSTIATIQVTAKRSDGTPINFTIANKEASFIREKYVQMYIDLVRKLEQALENFLEGLDGQIVDIKLFEGSIIIRELADLLEFDEQKKVSIENYNTFLVGLLLVYLDEYLECTDEEILVLRRIKHFLSKVKINKFNEDVVNLYHHKAEFLEYKIKFRNSHYTKEGEKGDIELPNLDEKNFYKPFQDKLLAHYSELEKSSSINIQNKVSASLAGDDTTFLIEPLHNYNKFYNKLSPKNFPYRKEKVDDLLRKLKEVEPALKIITNYEKIAYKSIYNLLSNSSLHLRLKIERASQFPNIIPHFQSYIKGDNKDAEPVMLASFIKNVSTIAEESAYPDYFCYVILIKFLNSLNNFLLENPEMLVPEDDIKVKVSELRTRFVAIRKYLDSIYLQAILDIKESLRKMKTNEAKPVYLTMKECFIQYTWPNDQTNGVLFLDSSYILPNNFEKISKKVESWEAFLAPQMSLLFEAFEVALSGINVKTNIAAFEGKMKENEFKVVQIVALFVSIATFVLINVKIFDNKNGLESFGIIIGLAACFFLFNLFLYFIFLAQFRGGTAAKGFALKVVLWLITPLVLAVGSYLILNDQRYSTSSEIKEIRNKLNKDSSEIQKLWEQIRK